jgi:hypothetical protein
VSEWANETVNSQPLNNTLLSICAVFVQKKADHLSRKNCVSLPSSHLCRRSGNKVSISVLQSIQETDRQLLKNLTAGPAE